jgi:hypothetical protein
MSIDSSLPPLDLKDALATPQAPWYVSTNLQARASASATIEEGSYRRVTIYPSDPESNFILKYFYAHMPLNRSIKGISYLYNGRTKALFEANLAPMES